MCKTGTKPVCFCFPEDGFSAVKLLPRLQKGGFSAPRSLHTSATNRNHFCAKLIVSPESSASPGLRAGAASDMWGGAGFIAQYKKQALV